MFITKISALKLKEVESIAKLLKSELIYINRHGWIYGLSNFESVLFSINQRLIVTNVDGVPINVVFNVLDLKNFLKTVLPYSEVNVFTWCGDYKFPPPSEFKYKPEDMLESKMKYMDLFEKASEYISRDKFIYGPSLTINHLETDESFISAISQPATKGSTLFKFDEHNMLYVHKGIIPFNKSDSINLTIRDTEHGKQLVTFEVVKKKDIKIIVDMYTLKLQ